MKRVVVGGHTESHCADCCCARSWKALGITEYTGKSIPEHITELRATIRALLDNLDEPHDPAMDAARQAVIAKARQAVQE